MHVTPMQLFDMALNTSRLAQSRVELSNENFGLGDKILDPPECLCHVTKESVQTHSVVEQCEDSLARGGCGDPSRIFAEEPRTGEIQVVTQGLEESHFLREKPVLVAGCTITAQQRSEIEGVFGISSSPVGPGEHLQDGKSRQ